LAPSSRQRKFDLACAASRSARLAAVDVNIWTMKLRCEFLRERERERDSIRAGGTEGPRLHLNWIHSSVRETHATTVDFYALNATPPA
jgi:hypothetical protein